jgi:hypothetical protein
MDVEIRLLHPDKSGFAITFFNKFKEAKCEE